MQCRSLGNVSIGSSLAGSVVCIKDCVSRLVHFVTFVVLVCVWLFEDVFSADVFVTVLKKLPVQ